MWTWKKNPSYWMQCPAFEQSFWRPNLWTSDDYSQLELQMVVLWGSGSFQKHLFPAPIVWASGFLLAQSSFLLQKCNALCWCGYLHSVLAKIFCWSRWQKLWGQNTRARDTRWPYLCLRWNSREVKQSWASGTSAGCSSLDTMTFSCYSSSWCWSSCRNCRGSRTLSTIPLQQINRLWEIFNSCP